MEIPCSTHIDTEPRVLVIWKRSSNQGFLKIMIVQQTPTSRANRIIFVFLFAPLSAATTGSEKPPTSVHSGGMIAQHIWRATVGPVRFCDVSCA